MDETIGGPVGARPGAAAAAATTLAIVVVTSLRMVPPAFTILHDDFDAIAVCTVELYKKLFPLISSPVGIAILSLRQIRLLIGALVVCVLIKKNHIVHIVRCGITRRETT